MAGNGGGTATPLMLDFQLMGTPDSISRINSTFAPYLLTNIRYVVVNGAAGASGVRSAIGAVRNGRKILVGSALSSLPPAEVKKIYNRSSEEVTLDFAELALRVGAGGICCSVSDLDYLREGLPEAFKSREFTIAVYGVRPSWHPDFGTHRVVMTPREAMEKGADLLIIGSPIRKAKNKRAAVRKILKEIGKDLPSDSWRRRK